MKNYFTFACFALSIFATDLQAQENKSVAKGERQFDQFAFIDSRKVYLKVVENGYQSSDIYQKLGDSYYLNGELPEAVQWYDAYLKSVEAPEEEYLFRYAQCLKSIGQYREADALMEQLYKTDAQDDRANLFVNERNYLDIIALQSGRYELSDVAINSEYSDFAPSFYMGQLVFASNRPRGGRAAKIIHDWNNQPFLDLYIVQPGDDSNGPGGFSKRLNSKYHESTAIFTKDGKKVFFTRNNFTRSTYRSDEEGTNRLKLYVSKLNSGKWSEPEEVPFNSDEYSVAHPALSPDEKTLYFASDMPGGEGLSDLYKVELIGDLFGDPESLGDVINTEGRETFPYVDASGNLYFASDGHLGLGGLDVFIVAPKSDGSFGEGFNLGEPVNSTMDDFTFIINETSGIGYFASNREGGIGSDDIYSFKRLSEPIKNCIQLLAGTVRDKSTDDIIPGARLLLLDEANNVVAETTSAGDGSFDFDTVSCNKAYGIRASKVNYDPDQKSFVTGIDFDTPDNQTLYLNPKPEYVVGEDLGKVLDLNPIYFDLDKSFIRPDAEIELQKVIAALQENPELKIDIRSHTDSRSDDDYNMKLSQRRNVSTIKYIIEKGGVSPARLTGRGYGETALLNACANGIECPEELHQLNRRSEFIIVEK